MSNYSERLLAAIERASGDWNWNFKGFQGQVMQEVDAIEEELGERIGDVDDLVTAIDCIRHPDAYDIDAVERRAKEYLLPFVAARRPGP